MSISKKFRLSIIASTVMFAAAAPAAFAEYGSWDAQGFHTDPGGTPDAPAARHSREVMEKNSAAGSMTANAGTWYQGIHTDPGGTADAPAARHSQEVMQMKVVPSNPAVPDLPKPWVPPY